MYFGVSALGTKAMIGGRGVGEAGRVWWHLLDREDGVGSAEWSGTEADVLVVIGYGIRDALTRARSELGSVPRVQGCGMERRARGGSVGAGEKSRRGRRASGGFGFLGAGE